MQECRSFYIQDLLLGCRRAKAAIFSVDLFVDWKKPKHVELPTVEWAVVENVAARAVEEQDAWHSEGRGWGYIEIADEGSICLGIEYDSGGVEPW
jgi:hypothetical protein